MKQGIISLNIIAKFF